MPRHHRIRGMGCEYVYLPTYLHTLAYLLNHSPGAFSVHSFDGGRQELHLNFNQWAHVNLYRRIRCQNRSLFRLYLHLFFIKLKWKQIVIWSAFNLSTQTPLLWGASWKGAVHQTQIACLHLCDRIKVLVITILIRDGQNIMKILQIRFSSVGRSLK